MQHFFFKIMLTTLLYETQTDNFTLKFCVNGVAVSGSNGMQCAFLVFLFLSFLLCTHERLFLVTAWNPHIRAERNAQNFSFALNMNMNMLYIRCTVNIIRNRFHTICPAKYTQHAKRTRWILQRLPSPPLLLCPQTILNK